MKNIESVLCENSKFIDVFFQRNLPENIRDFFIGAKPIKSKYEDITFSFTEYTPSGKADQKATISADFQLQTAIRKRNDYIERFKGNKYANVELVEALVLSESEKICINSHFHVGELIGDYAEIRIKSCGNNDYHCYQGTIDIMEEIVGKVRNGAIPRIWYGHNAQDLCGLMSLLYKLKDIDCPIIELELPEEVRMPNGRKRKNCRSWGQFYPEELCIPISGAKVLTEEKKQSLLTRWQNLVKENTEYRVYENGELKSVDFEYLRAKAIPHFYKNKFSLTKLTGRLLEKEEAFKDLCVVSALPRFIYRLIDVGDVEFLGHRVSIFEDDCWLKSLR